MSERKKTRGRLLKEENREIMAQKELVETVKDMEATKYEEDCTVTVLNPIAFGDDGEPLKEGQVKPVKEHVKKPSRSHRKKGDGKTKDTKGKENGHPKEGHQNGKGHKKAPAAEKELHVPRNKTAEIKNTGPSAPTGNLGTKELKEKLDSLKLKPLMIKFTLGTKGPHPLKEKIKEGFCFYANGQAGATVKMKRGQAYILKFEGNPEKKYEVILTSDPSGGKGAKTLPGTTSLAIGKQDALIVIDRNSPQVFYYQDRNHEFLGGTVLVE